MFILINISNKGNAVKIHQMLENMSVSDIEEGAVAFFTIGVAPYAMIIAYVFSRSSMDFGHAYLINTLVGIGLFLVVNLITKTRYNFEYKPTLKSFTILLMQLIVIAVPASAIMILFSIQAMALSIAISSIIGMFGVY